MHRRSVRSIDSAYSLSATTPRRRDEWNAGDRARNRLERQEAYDSQPQSRSIPVLTTLRVTAVLLGIGIGSLVSTASALIIWFALAAAGVAAAPDLALVMGILTGMIAGGFGAGRATPLAGRFHGMIAGLGLAGLLLIIARLGGSPAPTAQVLLLAVIGITLGGVGGMLGGRTRSRPPSDRRTTP